ncbi:hypothetical protein [Streptomyces similanensis]|uniref:Tape measure protein n=1 Tax=Streptomyces similanensis TaxID=1274988 RepID=A0ABP9L8H2_9ACTN
MGEGLQAGRLDVPVVADLAGFAEKLRTQVEAAAEGLAAKIKVKIDDKGLRKKLKKAVEEASKGVTATVRVKVDENRFRQELDNIRRQLGDADFNVPVRPNGDGDGSNSGGLRDRLRRLINGAQRDADRNPVNVPVRMKTPGRGRGSLRMLGIGSLISLAEPAVALITQYGAGLTALVSSAAPAVGVLGAIPGLISAAGTAAIGTKIAFSGFSDALKESLKVQQEHAAGTKVTKAEQQKLDQAMGNVSKSTRKTVLEVTSLSGAWSKVKKSISERFFTNVAGDVKPLAKSVLPLLEKTLGGTADQMGKLADRGAKYMKTGVFKKDFKTIAATNSKVVGNFTNGLANLGHTAEDFLVASGPFAERVGKAGENLTRYMRASVQAGRETGSLARFLDHAGDKAAQLGRSTGSLIKGLGGVGRAAMDTGDNMLNGLEGSMKRFERYANSKAGQKAMKQYFSDTAPAFHEVNLLFGDLMRGLGKTMKDGGVTDLVRQIRLQLMPAIGTFFNALGHTVGPAVLSVLSNIATAIANVSAAGSGLGVLLVVFNGLLHTFNSLMHVIPGANTALAVLLGTLLALKVITGVTGILGRFGTSVRTASTSARTLSNTLRGTSASGATSIGVWSRMTGVYGRVSQQGNRVTGTLRGIAAANRVAGRAVGGLMSTLGGPLGIALTGITIGLGLYASKQEAAARAAQEHEEQVENLSRALADSGGVIDANVRAAAATYLQDVKLADGKGKLVDVLRDANVSLKDVTDAYLEQGGSVTDLQKKLNALAENTKSYVEHGRDNYVLDYSDQGKKYKAAADALGKMNGTLQETKKRQQDLADATNGGAAGGQTAFQRLQTAVDGFTDKTKSASDRTEALKQALDALNGNTQSFHDAETQLNSVMLQVDDAMKANIDHADGWGKALIGSDKLVNTSTKNGQQLDQQMQDLRTSMLGVVTSAKEAGEQGLMPMSTAMAKGKTAMENARKKALELARDMGIPKAQAKALVDQMGFIPSTIETLVTTDGVSDSMAEIMALRGKLEDLKPGQSIHVEAPKAAETTEQLQDLGFTVQRIPGKHEVVITAPTTKGVRLDLAALSADIAAAPDKKNVTVQAIIDKAVADLGRVQDKIASTKGKSVTMSALTATAEQALRTLGFKVESVPGVNGAKQVVITAPTGPVLGNVGTIQGAINGISGKTVYVSVAARFGDGFNSDGSVHVSGMGAWANGGILKFANGGIHRAASRIKAFANGAERHIAQIARPGEMRLWAERETGGEAYIPLAPGKRKRSEQILERVAQMFGGRVVYFAQGAMRQYASGAVRTSSSASGVRTRTAAAQAVPALVGGDLNLTMAGKPMSPSEALGDALFELRRMRLGGSTP